MNEYLLLPLYFLVIIHWQQEKSNNHVIDGIETGIDGRLGRGRSFVAPDVSLLVVDPFDDALNLV